MLHISEELQGPALVCSERWLGDERYVDDERAAVQPFSMEREIALGKK